MTIVVVLNHKETKKLETDMLYDAIIDKKFVSGNLKGLVYTNARFPRMTAQQISSLVDDMNNEKVVKGVGGSNYVITDVRVMTFDYM